MNDECCFAAKYLDLSYENEIKNRLTSLGSGEFEISITNEAKGKYIERCTNLGSTQDDEYEWSGKIANTFVKELKQYGDIISYQKEADVPGDKWMGIVRKIIL